VNAIKAKFDPLLQFRLIGPQREQFGPHLRVVFHSH
jgi:plasmid stabilization system protein ParE